MFSLLGFEQAVQWAERPGTPEGPAARGDPLDPDRRDDLHPRPVAFIGALDPACSPGRHLVGPTTAHSSAIKALNAAPFYSVAKVAGLAWLASILRLDAFISPGGTGLIYLTSASRISFGLSKNGYIPDTFEPTRHRRVPVFGIVVSALIGLLFLLRSPAGASSWGSSPAPRC